MSTAIENTFVAPTFSADENFTALQPKYDYDLMNQKKGGTRKLSLPGVSALLPASIQGRVNSVLADRKKNGITPNNSAQLRRIMQDVKSQLASVRGIKQFLAWAAKKKIKLSDRQAVKQGLQDWTAQQENCRDHAMTKVLAATRSQERALRSLHAFFDVSGCEGVVRSVYLANIDPITTELTRERKESSFKEMPREWYVGDSRPILRAAAQEDGTPFPVTLIPLAEKLVFQTRTAIVGLGVDLDGLVDAQWWATTASNAGALAIGNCSLEHIGGTAWSDEKKAKVMNDLSSEDPAMKSLLICGNHPVTREASDWESTPVTVYPSLVYAGLLLRNEVTRKDLCFSVPPVNPNRDKIVGKWFIRPICATLRDRKQHLLEMPMAVIAEMSNKRLDDIVKVFSSSRTAYSRSCHSAELELAVNLARSIVQHWLLMQSGISETQDEAQRIGRELNVLFKSLSSSKFQNKPFLAAGCDSNLCRLEDQLARNDNHEVMLDDATGEPLRTGRKVMVFPLWVRFRKGIENFEVHLLQE